jgi:DNA-binding NarL/FixJ family response regulator
VHTVLIIDDHPVFGEGLESWLRDTGRFDVLASVTAVELAPAADVVVCDMRLPGRSGAAAVRHLVEAGSKVLAFSGSASSQDVLDVIAAGARGYVAKTASRAMFVAAVTTVADGRFHVSAELADYLRKDALHRKLATGEIGELAHDVLRRFSQGDRADEIAAALGPTARVDRIVADIWQAATRRRHLLMPTPRERDVMKLAKQNLSHKEIAAQLVPPIAKGTVSDYLDSIRDKFVQTHPDAPRDINPLVAAREWANEFHDL